MPQNPIVPRPGGNNSALNVTAATVVKATPGTVFTVSVTTAGSTVGAIHDCATTGAAAAGNLIAAIPEAVGVYSYSFPALVGIVVTPGTSQVVSVAFA